MIHYNKPYILVVVLLFLAISCRQEEMDTLNLKILSPVEGFSTDSKEAIPFHVKATNNNNVQYIRVALLDEDERPVGRTITHQTSGKEVEWEGEYVIEDSTLSSGNYKLTFYTSNGQREVYRSVMIKIEGVPKTTLGLLVFTETPYSKTNVYQIDNIGSSSLLMTLDANYLDAQIDNAHHRCYFMPKSKGEFHAINTQTGNISWTIPPVSTLSPTWFQGFSLINHKIYVGDYNAGLQVYDHNKDRVMFTTLPEGYMGKKFLHHNNRTYIYMTHRSLGVQNKVLVYNLAMIQIRDITFDYDLKEWFREDDRLVTVFYNQQNEIKIASLDTEYGNVNVRQTISGSTLNQVIRLSNTKFLLATSTGIVVYENTGAFPATMLLPHENIVSVEPNENGSLIAAASEKEVFIFHLSDREIVKRYNLPYDVKKALWVLN